MRKKKRNQINAKFAEYVTAYNNLINLAAHYNNTEQYANAIYQQDQLVKKLSAELSQMCTTAEEIIYLQELMESLNS